MKFIPTKGWSARWNIELSPEYQEQLLNLVAQGFFGEAWELIQKISIQASRVFAHEICHVQFDYAGECLIEAYGRQGRKR